ncbi:methylmalonyl-CoA mutase subunit beta [Salinimicrobium xinjiangense]|uniref:methylmalonyl-CoA mutase subunit beta n=1 Tax=Salinimicrobium xinjiangense TaxID=438596 RepID=UPI00040D1FAA|nr:methylmalonyl-CoA mutase subunit beta [Salinimicrobium xinjiangense]
MKAQLFKEFSPVSAEEWKQQITKDLKGADYDENLIFESPDGIRVKPYYTSEDIKGSIQLPPPKHWKICERIFAEDAKETNLKALNAIDKGAESLWFVISAEEISPEVLFDGINLEKIRIYIQLQFLSQDYIKNLDQYISGKKTEVYLQVDILANLARTGSWFFDPKKDIKALKSISITSNFQSVVSVDVSLYQNAGATIPQQLGYGLAHLNEYLNILSQKSQIPKQFIPQFILATGGNYFFEIAKFKALRWLYATLAREYGVAESCDILSQPTRRDKTIYDFNVNLLRTTSQSMSAVLGGANAISNQPYDMVFRKPNEFGERIARNQLLVLKHEAYFNKVANASDGAYYIENLTREFATAALAIFREIEKEGGFLHMLREGKIQQNIQQSANKEQELFDNGKLILVGMNKFSNSQDEMSQNLELDPFQVSIPNDATIKPIVEKRISEKQEQERIQKENAAITQS